MALQITKDSIDLGIITLDAEPMLKFYRDTLGLAADGEMAMPGGGQMTRLAQAAPGGIGGATGFRYFTISVSNLKEATTDCADAGYKIAVPATEIRAGITISIIEDPDGNWVELLQMG